MKVVSRDSLQLSHLRMEGKRLVFAKDSYQFKFSVLKKDRCFVVNKKEKVWIIADDTLEEINYYTGPLDAEVFNEYRVAMNYDAQYEIHGAVYEYTPTELVRLPINFEGRY